MKRVSRRTWKARGKVGRYRHYTKRRRARVDKRSIRAIRIGRHGKRMLVGCPKGRWSPRRGCCRSGLKAISMMVPVAKNPTQLQALAAQMVKRLGLVEAHRRAHRLFVMASASGPKSSTAATWKSIETIIGEKRFVKQPHARQYYGGNPPPARDAVIAAIQRRQFEAAKARLGGRLKLAEFYEKQAAQLKRQLKTNGRPR